MKIRVLSLIMISALALTRAVAAIPAGPGAPAQPAGPATAVNANDKPSGPDFVSAMKLFYQQDWEHAIGGFQKIVDASPRDTMAWFFLFKSYIMRNDLHTLVYQLEERELKDEKDPQSLAELGTGYCARYMKEPNVAILDESQKTLEKALEIDKNNSLAHCALGLVFYIRRMMPRAKGHFLEAYRLNSDDLMALERLGEIIMIDEKKPKEAEGLFLQEVAKAPDYPDGYWYVGSANYDMGNYQKCVQYMEKVMELDPAGVTQGYHAPVLAGKAELKLHDKAKAKEYLLRAQRLLPDSKEVQVLLKECDTGASASSADSTPGKNKRKKTRPSPSSNDGVNQ